MSFAFWAVLIAACLPLLWAALAKSGPGYDNHVPRAYLERLDGWRQRAQWAQQNAWEALTPFVAAVVIAYIMGVSSVRVDVVALLFLLARLCHGVCYIANLAALRSLSWMVSFGCVVYLFLLSGHVLAV